MESVAVVFRPRVRLDRRGQMCWRGESRFPSQATDTQNTLAVLWHSIICGVHLSQVNPIANSNQWVEEVQDEPS